MAPTPDNTTTDETTASSTLPRNRHLSAQDLRAAAAEELRDAARYVEESRDDDARDAAGAARALIDDAKLAEEEGR